MTRHSRSLPKPQDLPSARRGQQPFIDEAARLAAAGDVPSLIMIFALIAQRWPRSLPTIANIEERFIARALGTAS